VPPESPDHIELFVRSLEPLPGAPGLETTTASLERLADTAGVSFEVRLWGEALPLGSATARTPTAVRLHERVAELRSWARARDVELPGFERVETDTLVGPSREVLRLPPRLLAVYRGDELLTVAPHVDDGRHRDITAVLDRLADLPSERLERPTRVQS
jgi:hypothetical protein